MSNKTILFILSLLFFASCGGGGGGGNGNGGTTSEKTTEKVRFINAVKSEGSINVQLGDDIFVEELAYGDSTDYFEAQETTGDVKLPLSIVSSERVLPILSADESIASGSKQTFLIYDETKVVAVTAIDESKTTKPTLSQVKLRVLNLSEEEQLVDVYLLFPDQKVADSTAVLTKVKFKDVSSYISFPAGSYDIAYTETDTTKVVRRTNAVNFEPDKVYTHFLLDHIGSAVGQTSRIIEDAVF